MTVVHLPAAPGTLRGLRGGAAARLSAAGITAPHLEVEILAASLLGCSRAQLLSRDTESIPADLVEQLGAQVGRRAAGAPLQYLTGVQEFWSLSFSVDPRVLIPRPETEGIVEECLRRMTGPQPRIVDVGTGSGCIAVALAHERRGVGILAIDRSRDALEVARANASRLVPRAAIRWLAGDLLEPLAREAASFRPQIIASNPPYVADGEIGALSREVRDHEPRHALVAGETGLEVLERLIRSAASHLAPGGSLVMEIGDGQWGAVRDRFRAHGAWGEPVVREDFQRIPRVVAAEVR